MLSGIRVKGIVIRIFTHFFQVVQNHITNTPTTPINGTTKVKTRRIIVITLRVVVEVPF